MSEHSQYEVEPQYRESAQKIAFSLLRKWRCQISKDDVEGMAGVALVRAAQHYDPSHGTKFESFLFYYVKAELIKAIDGAVTAKKAVAALRDVVPEYEPHDDSQKEAKKDKEKVLPDPDRIAASHPVTPEGRMIIEERNASIHQAMQRIDEKHRRVLEMVFFKQADPAELKDKLGLTRSGIKRALNNAKKALEKELQAIGFENTLS